MPPSPSRASRRNRCRIESPDGCRTAVLYETLGSAVRQAHRGVSARMIVDDPPSCGLPLPDSREPATVLRLSATLEDESTDYECVVVTQRPNGDLLESQLLDRFSILEE